MAMKTCPVCKNKLASNANVCPHCGKRFTSRALLLFLLMLMIVFIASFTGLLTSSV